ncbi:hypothetical protein U9M48_020822 [Paspalum notatum var. saurae]|uniref:Uncharacterized protein n=1 Tax=Paspalum notatum var. saurae TaxID=547442 RepID=A0AAQ3TJ37_PASNO
MAARPATVLTMKLLVDKKAQRVLYAEAGKDVVDFLFSLLALPLSAVTKLLTASGPRVDLPVAAGAVAKLPTTTAAAGATMVGSVGNLYRSVAELDAGHVCCRDAKNSLLEPVVLHLVAAPAPAPAPSGGGLFRCKGCSCSLKCYDYVARVSGTPCPVCKGKMSKEVQLVEVESGGAMSAAAAGKGISRCTGTGYVRDMVTYTVMDDLSVAPMSTICAVTALVALGVSDLTGLEAKTVEIGYKEGLALLKASLQSQTVLTDVSDDASPPALSLKLLVDTKGQRVLYAEAGKDVVDFIFSLLALPVGTAVKLLGKESMVGCVGTYVEPGAAKDALLRPTVLSPAAGAKGSSLLRLSAPPTPSAAPRPARRSSSGASTTATSNITITTTRIIIAPVIAVTTSLTRPDGSARPAVCIYMNTEAEFLSSVAGSGQSGLVRGVVTYTVMDDLKVAPMSTISGITLLNTFGITDIGALKEKTVQLGYAEGLEILRQSLQSKTVLTDGLEILRQSLQSKTVLTDVFLGKKNQKVLNLWSDIPKTLLFLA